MALEIERWDVADYLQDVPSIAAYLSAILEDGDAQELSRALKDVARAKGGIEAVAKAAGLSAADFERTVDESGAVNLSLVRTILLTYGVHLSATAHVPELDAAA